MKPVVLRVACLIGLLALAPSTVAEAGSSPLVLGYLGSREQPPDPPSPLDHVAEDEGAAGARLGVADNNTTGRFTGQTFALTERWLEPGADVGAAVRAFVAQDIRFVIADLPAEGLLTAADAGRAEGMLVFNVRASDDRLRNEDCRGNMLHTAPSRAMLADGLAQYLVLKRWIRWFLVVGRNEGDALLADALRRSARRFGAKIVVEKTWSFRFGPGRADTGHVALQTEIPAFTRVADHDVLIVADEANVFGEYLPGRTALPRPVMGTQGVLATAWSPVHEQWGATQLQDRFRRQSGRGMTARDYGAWLAVRAIGEASVRTSSADPDTLAAFLRTPEFVLAGFKGQGLTFRDWDGQLRQPILIAGPRLLVSVSPQPGFLHQASELDTLGHDRSESRCRLPR